MNSHSVEARMKALCTALGQLCTEFASLETALGCALAYLACPEKPRFGLALVADMSFRVRLASFSTLYAQAKPAGFDESRLKAFVADAEKVAEKRNRLIHSFYLPGAVGERRATRIKATARTGKSLRIDLEPIAPEDVVAVSVSAHELLAKLDELFEPLGGYPRFLGQFYALFRND